MREAATGRCRVVAVVLPGQVADVRRALDLAGLGSSAGASALVTTRPPTALLSLLRPHVLVVSEEHLRRGPLTVPEAQRGQPARLVVVPAGRSHRPVDVPGLAAAVLAAATLAALQRWGLGYLDAARAAGLAAPPKERVDVELLLSRLRAAPRQLSGPLAEQVREAARLARGAAARHGLPPAEQRAAQEAAELVMAADLADPHEHPSAHLARAGALLSAGDLGSVVAGLGELALHELEVVTGTSRPDAAGLEHLPVHAAVVLDAVRAVRAAWAEAGYDVAGRREQPVLPHLLDTLA
ncbi:MAG TPA: hypothetical protein VFS29_01360 [Motilibacteraceae bacterium]|nr:hypothetical protein [Motilibacteraceae bacterium]